MDEARLRSIIDSIDSERSDAGMLEECDHQISPCRCEYGLMREAAIRVLELLDKERERVKELEDKIKFMHERLGCPMIVNINAKA